MKRTFILMSVGAGLAAMLSVGCPPARSYDTGGSGGSGGTSGKSSTSGTGGAATATCSDKAENGAETDVDCGGDCQPCPNGDKCKKDGDCVDGFCPADTLRCTKPSCMDGAKNAAETDIDCGGANTVCQRCKDGQGCNIGADCSSTVCVMNKCIPATCMDTMQNGTESDADCGGASCPGCADGKKCNVSTDCDTGVCDTGTCRRAKSCKELHAGQPSLPDGVYTLDFDGMGSMMPLSAYCDMTTDNGGWTALLNPVKPGLAATAPGLTTSTTIAMGGCPPAGMPVVDPQMPNNWNALHSYTCAGGYTLTVTWPNVLGAVDVMFVAAVQATTAHTITVNGAGIPNDTFDSGDAVTQCYFWNGEAAFKNRPGPPTCGGNCNGCMGGAVWCANTFLDAKPHLSKGALSGPSGGTLKLDLTAGPANGTPDLCQYTGMNIYKLFVR